MKRLFAMLILFGAPAVREAAIPYFSYVRDVAIGAPLRQNYIVADTAMWQHARRDLADIRLYDGQTQVPYVLKTRRGGTASVEQPAKILNLGSVGGHTEFDIDMGDIPQYDRVRLLLTAKNYVATAETSGRNDLNQSLLVKLANNTIFDFSKENLGASSALKLPASSFRYLHIRLGGGIAPEEVKSAVVSNQQEEKASWTNAGDCHLTSAPPKTIFTCSLIAAVPVSHLVFPVAESAVNFRRTVVVADEKGVEMLEGQISRIRMVREGQAVDSEKLDLNLPETTAQQLRITVENGDDVPLPLPTVLVQSVERRVYFDPSGKIGLKLYYGDDKLLAPSYDYAKFFQEAPDAEEAKLSPDVQNPEYTGRPDERPWSERHQTVVWAAMLLAVALLAALAIREFKVRQV